MFAAKSQASISKRAIGTPIADGTEHLRISRRLPPRAFGKSRRNSGRSGFSATGLDAAAQKSDASLPGYRDSRLAARPSAGGRRLRGGRNRSLAHENRRGAKQRERVGEASLLSPTIRKIHSLE